MVIITVYNTFHDFLFYDNTHTCIPDIFARYLLPKIEIQSNQIEKEKTKKKQSQYVTTLTKPKVCLNDWL